MNKYKYSVEWTNYAKMEMISKVLKLRNYQVIPTYASSGSREGSAEFIIISQTCAILSKDYFTQSS